MIGVVLWSDPEGKSAVFWCEDQGDLAYFERQDAGYVGGSLFVAGDMVQFDVTYDGKMRRAVDPHLLQEKVCQSLPSRLRQTAQAQQKPQPTPPEKVASQSNCAKVIPFEGRRAMSARSGMRALNA